MKKISKEYKIIYDLISDYEMPSEGSISATNWLSQIKQSGMFEKKIIDSKKFLVVLYEHNQLQKIGDDYVPSEENYNNGFLEVSERTIFSYKGKSKAYTVLFTEKGREKFFPLLQELILKE